MSDVAGKDDDVVVLDDHTWVSDVLRVMPCSIGRFDVVNSSLLSILKVDHKGIVEKVISRKPVLPVRNSEKTKKTEPCHEMWSSYWLR